MVCVPATCSQAFEGGTLSGSPSGAVVAVYGAYRDVWMAAGGPTGSLGLPVRAETCNGHDCSQVFQGGTVVWTPAHGAVTVAGWFLSPWQAQGAGLGRLGAPTAAMVCVPATCSQAFEGGTLSGSPSGAVLAVYGPTRDAWNAAGGPTGSLGLPVTAEVCTTNGCSTRFERGTIGWSSSTGAVAVVAPIVAKWDAAGGMNGQYGLPVAAATTTAGVVSQQFQRGTISAP